jgi:hypothetical protein
MVTNHFDRIINKELKRNTQQRGWGALSARENGGGAKSWSPRLERQNGQQCLGDKPEIGQIAVNKVHLLMVKN